MSKQQEVRDWAVECFGAAKADDLQERLARFAEESLELLQSLGFEKERVAAVADYVYGREPGDPEQEVGGTMTTLYALCASPSVSIDVEGAAAREIKRIQDPSMIQRIRTKNLGKPRF